MFHLNWENKETIKQIKCLHAEAEEIYREQQVDTRQPLRCQK